MEEILQIAKIMRQINNAKIIAATLENIEFVDNWTSNELLQEILVNYKAALE
ncbi:hypothetical protein [Aminipila sp.]|uniref:hypothetical protein n=1 Tax=Aminipila sp. TaxID=2060095 RepID=UPI0028A0A273|nr:hypothetical protein [Aminipila sp.]